MMNVGTAGWLGFISWVFIILSFYFTLTFFESLHKDDERVGKQSKSGAIVCLGIALILLPLIAVMFKI